jgi:hypothetical protein
VPRRGALRPERRHLDARLDLALERDEVVAVEGPHDPGPGLGRPVAARAARPRREAEQEVGDGRGGVGRAVGEDGRAEGVGDEGELLVLRRALAEQRPGLGRGDVDVEAARVGGAVAEVVRGPRAPQPAERGGHARVRDEGRPLLAQLEQ